jgi:release factor glutamine methyltransferase
MIILSGQADSLRTALDETARRLAGAGIPEPRREARLLVSEASGLAFEALAGDPGRALEPQTAARLGGLLARRLAREPLAMILGRREFWSLPFAVTRDTLVPRPETETLVEAALTLIPDRRAPLRLLDLGCGTGCLLLALLTELPGASGLGIDASLAAARIARQNAAVFGLLDRAGFIVGDWGAALPDECCDFILSNPPYIPAGEIEGLAPEIARYEPRLALSGGPDGLNAYRELAPALGRLLRPGGYALVEVGQGQIDRVARLLGRTGLAETARLRDLAGIPRCLIMGRAATRKKASA